MAMEGRPYSCFSRDVLIPLFRKPAVFRLLHRVRVRLREHKMPVRIDRVQWRAHEKDRRVYKNLRAALPLRPMRFDNPDPTIRDALSGETKAL